MAVNVSDYSWPLADPTVISRNRQGEMTPQQRSVLSLYVVSPYWSWIAAFVMLALILSPFWWPGEQGLPLIVLPIYLLIFGGMALLVIGGTAWYTWRTTRLRREIRYGPIAHSPGTVAWNGREYAAAVPGKQLRGAIGKIDLLPGEYHFYFLPRSGFLLSAEPITVDISQSQAQIAQNLGRTFGSKLDELPLNRSGRLSARQRLRLLWGSAGYSFLALLMLPLTYSLLLGYRANNETTQPWVTGCFILIGVLSAAYLLWLSAARLLDVLVGECRTVTGPLEIRTRGGGRGSVTMMYVIQGQAFDVPYKAYFSVVQGIPYHLHYAARSKVVASVEPAAIQLSP